MPQRLVSTTALVVAVAAASLGCSASGAKPAASPKAPGGVCERVGMDVLRFGEVIEDAGAVSKGRLSSYAGLVELLVSFERASADLGGELASARAASGDASLASAVDRGVQALGRARDFARSEREAIERHARDVAPLARETQQAWAQLRAACEGKKAPPDCAGVRALLAKYDGAKTGAEHLAIVDELAAVRAGPPLARARDRAVGASRAVQAAITARTRDAASLPKKWAAVQQDVEGAMNALATRCRGTTLDVSSRFVTADRPDPRKLTVLVKVRPPAKVERTLTELASASDDDDERALFEARAKGAFGSGFVVVRRTPQGSGHEVLVITNRHVVDLGDRTALELADGSSLGQADIVYADATRDVAILRPKGKLAIDRGFAFSATPAKDQQVVIATGFPGLVGRPSYQTTRGYVSNESFRLDDPSRPRSLSYVQHTAPIDPGSSGGPLTDERGHVLGVNTLKVTNREAVGLAVPSSSILATLRRADAIEKHHASPEHRRDAARLACLGFVAELANEEPRMTLLEPMISNQLTGEQGFEAAKELAGDETFEHVWEADSVRAMRIATLVRVRASMLAGGGANVLETCNDAEPADLASIATSQQVRYRIRLANFETREMAVRWEQGQFKVAAFEMSGPRPTPPKAPKRAAPDKHPKGVKPDRKNAPAQAGGKKE